MQQVRRWVAEMTALTRPEEVVWCDGSDAENERLVAGMLADGTLIKLNAAYPDCYLHRSHPSDVSRTEQVTFICSREREDAGPTNNWWDPAEAKERLAECFKGCMKGRTMYVVPYLMGPPGSPSCQLGVELTDSPYVAASLRIMTRVGAGAAVLASRDDSTSSLPFVRGLHSLGEQDPQRRYICHFPEERLICSYGSGYGGNALLPKKCHALRIASAMARDEGWLAEHMLIVGVERPDGETVYLAGAFPSACGKTNLAMLRSRYFESRGYRVWTVGDDIAWLRIGADGRLRAVNPEAGCFGVAPGTSETSNPNALAMVGRESLFTNVAMTPDGRPWWEGLTRVPPPDLIDWQGRPWTREGPAAHPNSRFTTPIRNCPSLSPHWEDPEGVPITAFLFGGRRARLAPLVYQAFDWEHGVFIGAGMGSEMTAAATGQVGKLRRDPFAMLPFCGYHMGDYFRHWLRMGQRIPRPPAIFHINWFRKGQDGNFLWPGYGDNMRVLLWIIDRAEGGGKARETPIGYLPTPDALDLEGLNLTPGALQELLSVDCEAWQAETEGLGELFGSLRDRLPSELEAQRQALLRRLSG
jgi:phosphoenolpyruvate carboxykinase (GTP)